MTSNSPMVSMAVTVERNFSVTQEQLGKIVKILLEAHQNSKFEDFHQDDLIDVMDEILITESR